jgi:hypothetical protein
MIECGEFMDGLEALGVACALAGDRLRVSAAPGVLSAAQEMELARRWETIERLVRSAMTPWGQASPGSTSAAAVQLTMGEVA